MRRWSLVTLLSFVAAITPPGATAQETSLRAWPEYQVILWQGGSAAKQPDKFPLYYQRLQEMGVSAGMVYGDGDLRPVLAAKFPYYVENMVNRGLCLKFSSKVTDWDAFDPIEARKTPAAWNFAPWADHRTYMDVSLARELDRLRTTTREMDSATPVGIEGTQMPAAFGGYDLWRMLQALDWVEPYDICDARTIFGSFMPGKTFLTTVGEKNAADARRRLWHLLLEGDRGCIVWWSEDCIDWNSPDYKLTQRARDLTPVFREMRSPLAALFMQARRDRDPIAIHYSHPGIQVAWLLESTVDGSTWLRRFSSYESAHNRHARVRHGWLKMLEDAGYDPVFVSTQQIEAGELSHYKALVLPQSWAMSDAEATGITKFLNSTDGPRTILADGQAGLFDEHGRLRTTGTLDAMIAPSSTASAVVRRSDKPVPRDHVSFDASPAAYANAEAGCGREQTSGWVDKIRDEWLNYVPPMVVVRADARAWKRGQEPIAKWPEGCGALLVPDPFSKPEHPKHTL